MSSGWPTELSSFVGRAEELGAVAGELRRGGLVTLVGPGGIGKTRLALRAAGQYRAGPAHWFDLQAVQADGLPGALEAGLGTVVSPGAESTAAIASRLGDEPTLIVLDNCEHLLDTVAPLVEGIRARCPAVTILATSRAPLDAAGERVRRVPPLGLADALALFLDRMAGSGGTVPEVARARRICDQLDRLPLALELAAGWAETLSLEQISTALQNATLSLTGGSRTAPFRQRSLAASIRWSYDLLDEPERRLLRRLAVFAPGFDADAVAALATATGDAAAESLLALRRLVATSLVVADTRGAVATYRLLATIQEFALARLVEDDDTEIRAYHLDLYLARAQARLPLMATDMDAWRAATRVDYPNARSAVDWGLGHADPAPARRLAVLLARFWESHGEEGLGLLDRAVALGEAGDPVLHAECLVAWALVAMTTRPTGSGVEETAAALAAAERAGATTVIPLARSLLANAWMFVDPRQAGVIAQQALAEAVALGDDFVADASRLLLGLLAGLADDHHAAVDHLEPATRRLLERGHRGVASTAAAALARSTAMIGDLAGALAHATTAVAAAEPLRELHRIGIARSVLTEVLILSGQLDAATEALDQLDALLDTDAAPAVFVPGRELAHAHLALATGLAAQAVDWCRRAGTWRGATRDDELDPPTRIVLVAALSRAGDPTSAHALAATLTAADLPPGVRAAAAAERARMLDDPSEAIALQHDALRIRQEHGLVLSCVDSLEALAALLDEPTATVLRAAARRTRDETGYRLGTQDTPDTPDPSGSGPAPTLTEAIELVQRARGPRRRPLSGWDSLTPTELSVVELAALGLSNPEIGARLYIGRGTVKTHLAHVYAKLGVANRTELARVVTASVGDGW